MFASYFSALGVKFAFEDIGEFTIEVSNKPERAERAAELIQLILRGHYQKNNAETLRGVLGFCRAQCFGRCGSLALFVLGEIVCGRLGTIDEVVKGHLEFWPTYLRSAPPRRVPVWDRRGPVLIFVDGAEDEKGDNVSRGRELMSGFKDADVCRSFLVGSGF